MSSRTQENSYKNEIVWLNTNIKVRNSRVKVSGIDRSTGKVIFKLRYISEQVYLQLIK